MRKLPKLTPQNSASVGPTNGHAAQNLNTTTTTIGKPSPHESAKLHLTGKALYIDDIPTPVGCLHAYVGMANVACGLLKSQNLSSVASALGVVDVITAKDVPGHIDIGPVFGGDPLLVEGQINYFGQPLFAVAAISRDAARKAALLGHAVIDSTPPLLSLEQAQINNKKVRPSHSLVKGDSAVALQKSMRRLTIDQQVGGQEHY